MRHLLAIFLAVPLTLVAQDQPKPADPSTPVPAATDEIAAPPGKRGGALISMTF